MPPPAPSSMNFLAPDNVRHQSRTSRGVSLSSASTSVEVSIIFATGLTGVVVAAIVYLLRFTIEQVESAKLDAVVQIWRERGALAGGAVYAGCCVGLVLAGVLAVAWVPWAPGSGLPPLIAYLNGCKLKRFTSTRVLATKWVGVMCAVSGGLMCGPEGPIIHIGACIGKQLLRLLYHLSCVPHPLFRAFRFLRNDLDQRDFVAIGAGAGVAAAFMAPLSATLFVVEEAATHFSVPLLWRAFSAAYVSMYTTHLIDRLRSGEFNGRGEFQVTFEPGTGEDCDFYDLDFVFVVILGAICGAAGALFNASIVRLRRWRQRVLGGGVCIRLTQAAFVSLLTAGTCAALSAALPCVPRSVGQLEYAHFDGSNPGGCAPPYGQCGGDGWGGPTCCTGPDWTCEDKSPFYSQCTPSGSTTPLSDRCMSEAMREEIRWDYNSSSLLCTSRSCLDATLNTSVPMLFQAGCDDGKYSPYATVLMQSADNVVKALFLRGAPQAVPFPALAVGLLAWFVFTVLAADLLLPVGLMLPMIVIGAAIGRSFGLALLMILKDHALDGDTRATEPGLYALVGATALMAGSGRIRLFLTVVMLEVTGQLRLAPFVAAAAVVGVAVGGCLSPHGLYHALIHADHLPYLPFDRPAAAGKGGDDGRRKPRRASSTRRPWQLTLAWWRRPSPPPQLTTGLRTSAEVGGSAAAAAGDGADEDPFERSHDYMAEREGALLVADVMACPLVCVRLEQCRADAEGVLASSTHSGFPVVRDDGTLCGLLLRDELVHFDADAPLGAIMDRSPVVVHSGWPLSRAHRLFAALGLRHLVVVDPRAGGTPVGIVTRHDLCERCNAEWQRADATPTATLSRAHASAAEATEGRSSSAELRRARESELGSTRTVGAARC